MNRRRFVVTAVSAAAVTAVAIEACSGKGSFVSPPTDDVVPVGPSQTIAVKYATTNIAGYKLRGRTYGGKTYGPMLETRPGDTLSITIVNDLPPNPPAVVPSGSVALPAVTNSMEAMEPNFRGGTRRSATIDDMNNPHGFNTTNLHVHGLQTIPHLFEPLGTSDPSAPMIEIEPGQSFTYAFPIPPDHPSGLHWYHPHKHGSTDVQVSNGMAGLIVVRGPIDEVPEIAAAKEIFMVVQTLDVNPSKTHPGIYEREYLAYKTPAEGGYAFSTQYTMLTNNGKGIYWIDNTTKSYKPLGLPQYELRPGEVIRLRFLNGTNYLPLMMVLPGFEAWQIGFDGVNTLEPIPIDMSGKGTTLVTLDNLFSAPMRLAMSANRIELLLRAPSTPGTYTLSSLASDGIHFTLPAINLANFVVSGSPVKMGIPKTLPIPTREYPVIEAKDVVAYRKFTLQQGPSTVLLTGFQFSIDNKLYDMNDTSIQPKVGTCEEWRIENESADAHPFHLHENSFQLIAINDVPNDPMEVWDTFIVPPKNNGKNGSITFRVRFVQWRGKTVFHCHITTHEDTGMMQNILMT